jgi:hypothetical protein
MNQLAPIVPPVLPTLVTAAGERASNRFLEFFAANIRNPHTRRAYYRAAEEFLAWCADAGVPSIAGVQPVHVATWIEAGTRELAAPSVKQRLAALRHLFDWLVNGQVVPVNPAHTARSALEGIRRGLGEQHPWEGSEFRSPAPRVNWTSRPDAEPATAPITPDKEPPADDSDGWPTLLPNTSAAPPPSAGISATRTLEPPTTRHVFPNSIFVYHPDYISHLGMFPENRRQGAVCAHHAHPREGCGQEGRSALAALFRADRHGCVQF